MWRYVSEARKPSLDSIRAKWDRGRLGYSLAEIEFLLRELDVKDEAIRALARQATEMRKHPKKR